MSIDPLLYGFNNYYDESDESDDEPAAAAILYPGENPHLQQLKKRAIELTRDQRLRIRCLHHDADLSYIEIYAKRSSLKPPMPTLTIRQIQKACDLTKPVTPQKQGRVGAKPAVSDEQKAALEAFLKEKKGHRLIPWIELPYWVEGFDNVRDSAIKRALEDMGYLRRERQKRIVHTEVHESERLRWAIEHKDLVSQIYPFYIQILTYLVDSGPMGRSLYIF